MIEETTDRYLAAIDEALPGFVEMLYLTGSVARFRTDRPCGDLNPVVWLLLSRYGISVRGPAVAELGLTVDVEGLRRFNLDNLKTYWLPYAGQIRAVLA